MNPQENYWGWIGEMSQPIRPADRIAHPEWDEAVIAAKQAASSKPLSDLLRNYLGNLKIKMDYQRMTYDGQTVALVAKGLVVEDLEVLVTGYDSIGMGSESTISVHNLTLKAIVFKESHSIDTARKLTIAFRDITPAASRSKFHKSFLND